MSKFKDTNRRGHEERERRLTNLGLRPIYVGPRCIICETPIPGYDGPLCESCTS